MGKKTYTYRHSLGAAEAARRIEPAIEEMAKKYGLKMERGGDGRTRLSRTGVEAVIEVGDSEVSASVELSWMLEKTLRGQVEKGIAARIEGLLEP